MEKANESTKSLLLRTARIPLIVLSVLCIALLTYHLAFWGKIYPGVTVVGVAVGGKTVEEATSALSNISAPQTIVFIAGSQEFTLDSLQVNLSISGQESAKNAYKIGRKGNFAKDINDKFSGLTQTLKVPLSINYDQEKFNNFASRLAENLFIPSIKPHVSIENSEAVVEIGKSGQEVDINLLTRNFQKAIGEKENIVIIPLIIKEASLTTQESIELALRAGKIIGKNIKFAVDQEELILEDKELARFLTAGSKYEEEKVTGLVEKLASQFSRPPQEPAFQFEGNRVLEFKPAKDGIEVEKEKLYGIVVNALGSIETAEQKTIDVAVPVKKQEPKIKTGDVNNLGIKELIGKGISFFRGSAASRAHNISLAANRLNGIIVAPGEVFSFNNALGDVSAFTGYEQAYVIYEGKAILGDGGGVCQVSSTLFRAAMATGLPIIERQGHSYRVSYYEQGSGPGLDATVYSPSPDLKIKNDTGKHILIQTSVDKKNMSLTFELYGTNDGRQASTTKPKVWDQVEPPPDVYQDDPTLPAGKVKQVNSKSWGAKVAFDYSVLRGSDTLQKRTFYTVYRPWGAVYLRGTAPQ